MCNALLESSRRKEEKVDSYYSVNSMCIFDISSKSQDVRALGSQVSSKLKLLGTPSLALDTRSDYKWSRALKQKFERIKVSSIKIARKNQRIEFSDRGVNSFNRKINRSIGREFFMIGSILLYSTILLHLLASFLLKNSLSFD